MTADAEKIVYPGKDLEAMSFAVRYHRWMLDEFRPFIGSDIVEVGAGSGSFSEMLLETRPDRLSLVEPSELFAELTSNVPSGNSPSRIEHHNAIFRSAAPAITAQRQPDTITYVNVLEHIEDDAGELELVRESLDIAGHVLIFVPAMPTLMSEFDRSIGHFRRYRKGELEKKVRKAGFKIVKSRYFDLAGIAPWFVKYRVMRSLTMGEGAVSAYDNLVVPIMKRVESIIHPPLGKNILLVGHKS